jgi:hypothetical protein
VIFLQIPKKEDDHAVEFEKDSNEKEEETDKQRQEEKEGHVETVNAHLPDSH